MVVANHLAPEKEPTTLGDWVCLHTQWLPSSVPTEDREGCVDVHFGFVRLVGPATAEEFVAWVKVHQGVFLTSRELPWTDGPSYIHLGAWIGDQGVALRFMGLGAALGLWSIILPLDFLGISRDEAKEEDLKLADIMAGNGCVALTPNERLTRFAEEITPC